MQIYHLIQAKGTKHRRCKSHNFFLSSTSTLQLPGGIHQLLLDTFQTLLRHIRSQSKRIQLAIKSIDSRIKVGVGRTAGKFRIPTVPAYPFHRIFANLSHELLTCRVGGVECKGVGDVLDESASCSSILLTAIISEAQKGIGGGGGGDQSGHCSECGEGCLATGDGRPRLLGLGTHSDRGAAGSGCLPCQAAD